MECPHCMQDATPRGIHMSDVIFEKVVEFCREAQPLVVNVTGGEPTEHPRWAQMVKELLSIPSIRILVIQTNGAWIDDNKQRIKMAKLIRENKGRVKIQVYSHPKYYQDHEWTVEHEARFKSLGCIAVFNSPIFMQDLGRARKNCREEVAESDHVPSCINSHLIAIQALSFREFLSMAAQAGKFCRPLIDVEGNIHMSESWLCPVVATIDDGVSEAFQEMRKSTPCKGCQLYKNFEKQHPVGMKMLNSLRTRLHGKKY